MSQKPKSILEQGAEAFMGALVKSAAAGVKVVAREVSKNGSRLVTDIVNAVECDSRCNCKPGQVTTTAEDGSIEVEEVHSKSCPARER